jgi:hypothetical protein
MWIPIHPWSFWLLPLVYACGFFVCLRFMRVSPYVPWLLLGFLGSLTPEILILLHLYESVPSWLISTIHPSSYVALIVGMAMVFDDVRSHPYPSRRKKRRQNEEIEP